MSQTAFFLQEIPKAHSVTVLFLQKAKAAAILYATLLYAAMLNCLARAIKMRLKYTTLQMKAWTPVCRA